MQDDNNRIITLPSANYSITQSTKTKEYILKFCFLPKSKKHNSTVATTHYTILQVINHYFHDSVIYDNHDGNILNDFSKIKTYDSYSCHFKLQHVKENTNKKCGDMYLAFHRIHTSMPISEIYRHNVIENLLHKVNTCLTIHHWQENETDIATLGFLVNIDPGNYLHDKFEAHLHHQICKHNNINKKKTPPFKCGYSSPFTIDSEGYRTLMKAHDIQCHHQDALQMIKYLKSAYIWSPMFVFHKLCHQDFTAYHNTICKQNSFLTNCRVIPITGISESTMFYLEQYLH